METTTSIPVRVGDCLCPGTPHADGDFVYIRPKLGLAGGIAIQKLVIDANNAVNPMDTAELTGVLAEGYLIHGIVDWNLVGESGPIIITADSIRAHLLNDFERSVAVADAADDLYMKAVLAPLLNRARTSSGSTLTNGSTSARREPTSTRPRRSKQSSTSTSPTDVTERTSP